MHNTINDLPDELLAAIFEERESAERRDRDVGRPHWTWDRLLHKSHLRVPTRDEHSPLVFHRFVDPRPLGQALHRY